MRHYKTLYHIQKIWQKIGECRQILYSLKLFETEVGIKYRHGRFNSDKFKQFAVAEKACRGVSSVTFSNLLLPPDLLKNQYTLCGNSLLHSPHFELMKAFGDGIFDKDNEYARRCQQGTLDARLPEKFDLERMAQTYRERRDELQRDRIFAVYVVEVIHEKEPGYIILDGKHRAAMVASLNCPECLCVRLVSRNYAEEYFFKKVYTYCLNSNPNEYSINQQVIRTIVNE